MGWNVVIEKKREALKRILASLAAMAGLAIGESPSLPGRCLAGQRGGRCDRRRGVFARPSDPAAPSLPRGAQPAASGRGRGPAADHRRRARSRRRAAAAALALPPLDPLKNPLRRYRRTVPPHAAPRILSLDGPYRRLPPHEVHELLADLQWFAREALERPDAS